MTTNCLVEIEGFDVYMQSNNMVTMEPHFYGSLNQGHIYKPPTNLAIKIFN